MSVSVHNLLPAPHISLFLGTQNRSLGPFLVACPLTNLELVLESRMLVTYDRGEMLCDVSGFGDSVPS